jgi:predicted nucleic acid-binding protein
MKLVVDANILFSALIKKGKTQELLFDLSLELFTPEFILNEFEKHKQEIIYKTKRTPEEFDEIYNILKEIINIIPKEDFQEYLELAKNISPDPNDIMYFALALKLNCPIWSNDKDIKEQKYIKVIPTHELIELI